MFAECTERILNGSLPPYDSPKGETAILSKNQGPAPTQEGMAVPSPALSLC